MSITPQDKKISVDENIFNHLPADVKLDALILRKLGRLVIVPSPQAACREMVRLGEMTIEGMPGQLAGAQRNDIRATSQ